MPSFQYKAVNDSGKVFKGISIAFDERDVERDLGRSGLSLIHSKLLKESTLTRFLSGKVKPRAVVEFYHRLAQSLEIGLPILSALEENGHYLPSKQMRKISSDIKVAVEGGRTLNEAMSTHPKVFKKLDLSIIRMGEQTGVLPTCLRKMADFLKWKEDLRSHIRRATIYPSFVIFAIIAVLGVWIGYVLPQMVNVLIEMDVAVPNVTILVLRASEYAKTNWLWFTSGGFMLVAMVFLYQKTKQGGLVFDKTLLKIPLLGVVLRNIALARLCENFATMFNAGMAIQQIFNTLSDNGLGNRYMEDRLKHAYREIEGGEVIAAAFENAGGFPSLIIGAIRNGEATGTLDDAFKRLGGYYDEEVKSTVQAMLSAIEPMAIISLGAIFGLIILSILLPLYDVMGSMGNAY